MRPSRQSWNPNKASSERVYVLFPKDEIRTSESTSAPEQADVKVSVKLFTTLREMIGKPEEIISLRGRATVGDALKELGRMHGQSVARYVFEGDKLRDYLQVLLDGRSLLEHGLETPLKSGNVLAILPPAGGG